MTLLHKLDMPGSARQIENNDCWEDGVQTPWYPGEVSVDDLPRTTLVLRCQDDDEHYGRRTIGPGIMHPSTEAFVREHGGVPGSALRTKERADGDDGIGQEGDDR